MTTTATTSDSNREGNTMPTDTQDVTVDDLARVVGDDDRLTLDRRFRDANLSTPSRERGFAAP